MSERILFCDSWLFHEGEIAQQPPALKGPVYTQAKTEGYRAGPAAIHYPDRPDDFGGRPGVLTHEKWEVVSLPHDYMIHAPICENANNALGFREYHPAWYRRHFTAQESWRGKRVEIEFLGVATECDLWLNGVWLHRSATQYTPFVVDLTDFLRFDNADNVLAVHVTQNTIENWWYNGGGICHKVYLRISDPVAVERDGVFLAPKKLTEDRWEVPVTVEVHNDGFAAVDVRVETCLFDADDRQLARLESELHIPARSLAVASGTAEVLQPRLWDLDDPYLHRARTRVSLDGRLTDEVWDRFGFRTLAFTTDRGFLLNGRPRYINGVCGHEDFCFTGKAVPDNVMRHKVRLLKEMGANAYRCAHSMQDEAFMDAFDEQGMLVMAETRHFSTAPTHMEELRTLIRRDRNRPAVFMWSVGNEEHYFITDEGRRIAEKLSFEARRLDPTRPVMTANDKRPEICTVYDASDLIGVNYNHNLYDLLHEKYPEKPIFASECSAASTSRGWYFDDAPQLGRMSAYDEDVNQWFISHEHAFRGFYERPWMMGGFVWSAMEYLGEAKWPRICSISGAIDLFLQKKDSFYQLQSYFTETPMVHLLPHWNMEGRKSVRVAAYTNCAAVELFVNGRSLGRQSCEKYIHNEWQVPFEPGCIRAVAYTADGAPAAEDVRVTAGTPYALQLRCENAGDICANGEDLALVTCYVTDADGREVPDAACEVTFVSDKGVRIVGTGSDNTDHTPFRHPVRRMYAGRVLAALLPFAPGGLTLYAMADGLKPACLTLEIPADPAPVPGRVYPAHNPHW